MLYAVVLVSVISTKKYYEPRFVQGNILVLPEYWMTRILTN
jgi:hypothetical protein